MSFFLRWRSSHWWGLLLLLGSLLRAWQFGAPPLWYDEITTAWMASLPLARMVAATAGDVHPPLFLFLEWLMARVAGPGAWAMRALPLAFSIGGLALLYPLARRMGFTARVALMGMALMAFAPFQWYYAQEARMYALLQLLVMLTLLAVLHRHWPLMALGMAALMWTHNYGAFYCAALGAWALWQERRGEWSWVLMYGASALLFYIPWALVLRWQMAAIQNTWWSEPTTPGAVAYALYALVWHTGLPPAFAPLGALVVFALVVAAVFNARGAAWMAAAWFVAPIIMALVVEVVYRPVFLNRALIGCAPALYLFLAHGLQNAPRRAALALAPLMLVGGLWFYPWQGVQKGGGFDVAQAIRTEWQGGDVIMHINVGTLVGMWPEANDVQPQYLWPELPGSRGTLTPQTVQALGVRVATLDEIEWRRVWVVWGAGPTIGGAEDALVETLLTRYPHTEITRVQRDTQTGGVWLLWRGDDTAH